MPDRVRGFLWIVAFWLCSGSLLSGSEKAAAIAQHLGSLQADSSATWHVRDLELNRGGIKFFLTDGILSFFAPVDGHVLGAVFTTNGVEGGDSELLLLPPVGSERKSLATATGEPNLDEHVENAVMLFSDGTAEELRQQLREATRKPASAEAINRDLGTAITGAARTLSLRLIESLSGSSPPERPFFFAALGGRTVGPFSLLFDPSNVEPITVGRTRPSKPLPAGGDWASGVQLNSFDLWTAFTPKGEPPYIPPANRFSDYRIEANIGSDLNLQAKVDFVYQMPTLTGQQAGHVLSFDLSPKMHVREASLDGEAAEIYQPESAGPFLMICKMPILPGAHRISIRYEGRVIVPLPNGSFVVTERTDWFPSQPGFSSSFDLVLHCPSALTLVATGDPVSETVDGLIRTVHRSVRGARPLAGFNLGHYTMERSIAGPYRIEVAETEGQKSGSGRLLREAGDVLAEYTRRWQIIPSPNLTISPISGSFGQGFPGLVYLSDKAYLRAEERPASLQGPLFDFFFSQLLLPHEIAHQWWGNLTSPASYRAAWFPEAMATYSALQYLEKEHGAGLLNRVLDRYRADLTAITKADQRPPQTVESFGPLDWGSRLLSSSDPAVWQTIVYEKGAWTLHMLRQRLGDDGFLQFQRRVLANFSQRAFTNADLEGAAAGELPRSNSKWVRDSKFEQFFQTWVYSTGIPKLELRREAHEWLLDVSQVDTGFTADILLSCESNKRSFSILVRATAGENSLPVRAAGAEKCSLPSKAELLYLN